MKDLRELFESMNPNSILAMDKACEIIIKKRKARGKIQDNPSTNK
tara:strand:+ start:287 stop:421 length:135 start_codon:yes stop_codon:yes gene_type:complete